LAGAAQEPTTASRLHALLVARSRLPVASGLDEPPTPDVRPDEGHASRRISIGYGRTDGRSFASIVVRPAYHDLLDPQAGFRENSQVGFFEFEARRHVDDDSLQLERFDLVNIQSVAPRNRFIAPSSWDVHVGIVRRRLPDGRRPLVVELSGGSAWAFRLPRLRAVVVHAGWHSELQLGHELPRSWRLGAGPRVGVLADLGRFGRLHLEAQGLWHLEESKPSRHLRLEQRVPLTRAMAVGVSSARQETLGEVERQFGAMLHVYF
ncbi:MAG: hypothetical protein GY711_16715, partial [bacterium]|nr:hypothetical protein [bacterium]